MTIISPKIYLYASSSYSQIDTPPEARQSIEFAPSDVDLLRYRLGLIYDFDLNYVKDSNPNAASIAYKLRDTLPIVRDVNYTGPYAQKEFVNLEPSTRQVGGSFAPAPNDSDNFNGEPSVNNWCNSFSEVAGVDNPFEIKRCITDESFSDHGFIFDFAVDERYKKLVNNPPNMKGASVDVVYNYYNQSYENVMGYQSYSGSVAQTNQFELDEKLLPSYYAISAILGSYTIQGGDFSTLINAGLSDGYKLFSNGTLDSGERFGLSANATDLFPLTALFSGGNYIGYRLDLKNIDFFTNYAKSIFSQRNSNQYEQILTNTINKQKNVILQQSQLSDLIRDTDDILSDLPMYTKISFDVASIPTNNGDVISNFVSGIRAANLSSRLIIANTTPQNSSDNPYNIVAKDGVPFVPDNIYDGSGTTEKLKSFNVNPQFVGREVDNDESFIAGLAEEEYNIATSNDFGNIRFGTISLQALAIYTNLNNQAGDIFETNSYRRFEDFRIGKPAPNFPIFYRVEKWATDANNNPLGTEPIQNFYVPNFDNSVDRVNVYDTQIKYGKTYIYRIYALNLTIGTDYVYSLNDITTPNVYNAATSQQSLSAQVCVESNPNIKIVETPYYEKLVVISDSPPLSPTVDVYPYLGDKNKIKILLKGTVGTELAMPINLRPGDQSIFDGIRGAFNLGPDEKIQFKSDDPSTKFEIFRLDFRPRTYDDFQFADFIEVETGGFKNPYKKASSAAMEDFLEPNKKYFYTFRAVDVHGKVSNPSPVYQLEISYDGASAFLLTKIIELTPGKTPPQTSTKKLRKFLRIKPVYQQTILNEEASGIINSDGSRNPAWFPNSDNVQQNGITEIKLGDEQNPLWGQTFKIRLTSKKSGKKLDLNVNFKTKKVIIDEKDVNNIS